MFNLRFGIISSMTALVLIGAATAARRLEAKNAAAAASALDVSTSIPADGENDIETVANYKAAMAHLLEQDNFTELDRIADSARSQKEKFPGGSWKSHTIYSGIDEPQLHATEEDWQAHLGHLQKWMSDRPDSITARVALAKSYVGYAFEARGDGWANTVSQSGWRLFRERLQKAKDTLDDAASLPAKCPEWYLAMQQVALYQPWGLPQAQQLFSKAVAFEPDYFYYYMMYADFLAPKWNGEPGDVERFAKETADRIGGPLGDIVYFRVATDVVCHCVDEEVLQNMSWRRIQRGYAELEKRSGSSYTNQNAMAYLAIKKLDWVVADQFFRRIGDHRDDDVWDEKYFADNKKWAVSMAPSAAFQQSVDDAIRAHIRSSNGAAYAKDVASRFRPVFEFCSDKAKDDSVIFKLTMKIQKDGEAGQMMTSEMSPTASCFFQKIGEWRIAKATPFALPPEPDYWLAFDINPRTSTAQVISEPPEQD